MLYIWPAHIFNPTSIKADPVENVITGGAALNGDEDVIATDGGGRWKITFGGIVLRSPKLIRAWDAWTSHMAGGARAFLAPLVSGQTAPRPFAGSGIARPSALHADDDLFATAVGYASPFIVATTVGNAALRATALTINVAQGARLNGGEKFSIGRRAHKVERVTARAGQQATVIISPPLRQAVAGGSAVNFEWPVVQAKLIPGQDLTPDLAFGRRADMSISFVEDFSDAS